jgi:hypothetical protein
VVSAARDTKLVETRYEIRAYRDGGDPSLRHESHAVYRATRVPARMDTLPIAPRTEFAPMSYAPLPANTELSAELSTQKQITDQLRAIQTKMAAMEQAAKQQYGTLVNQTQESVKLRQELEAARARVRELEAQQREHAPAEPADKGASAVAATAAPDMRW